MTHKSPNERLVAGPHALRALADLLKLPLAPEGGRGLVVAVAHSSSRIEVEIRGRSGTHSLFIKEATAGDAYVMTPQLGLALSRETVGERAGAWLRGLGRRIGHISLEEIIEIIRRDPGTRQEHIEKDGEPSDSVSHGTYTSCGKATRNITRFFDDYLDHELWEPYFNDQTVVVLQHGDMECFFSHPNPDAHHFAFYNDPRLPLPRHARRACPKNTGTLTVMSELREREVMLGHGSDHHELLSTVARLGADARLFVLNHLCTPVVLGEDLDALARQCAEVSGRAVIPFTRDNKVRHDFLGRVLDAIIHLDHIPVGERNPRSVNLIGFPEPYRSEEALPWLHGLGLAVEGTVLPEVSIASLKRWSWGDRNLMWEG